MFRLQILVREGFFVCNWMKISTCLLTVEICPVVGTVSIQVVQNTGLQVIADNVQVAIHANWRYREREFPHISDSGNMDAHTTVSCRVLVHAGTDGQRLQVDIDKNVYLAMSDFDVTMHGGASWLYSMLLLLLVFCDNVLIDLVVSHCSINKQ